MTITERIDQQAKSDITLKFLIEEADKAQRKFDELWDEVKDEYPNGLPWTSDNWALLLAAHADVVEGGRKVAQYSQQIADAEHARCRNDWDGVTGEH